MSAPAGITFATSGHCCACNVTCMHVGGPWYCDDHKPRPPWFNTTGAQPTPPTPWPPASADLTGLSPRQAYDLGRVAGEMIATAEARGYQRAVDALRGHVDGLKLHPTHRTSRAFHAGLTAAIRHLEEQRGGALGTACTCPVVDVTTAGERPGTRTKRGHDPNCPEHGTRSDPPSWIATGEDGEQPYPHEIERDHYGSGDE